jgi:predicted peptidase
MINFPAVTHLLLLLTFFVQKPVDGFEARTFRNMPYRLFTPAAYDRTRKYPLILWLHGAGSVGGDNFKQISGASLRGTHTWIAPAVQAKHPAFVLAPQSHGGGWDQEMPLVLGVLDLLKKEFNIDPSRIYIAGQSMGGFGTWDYITARPDLFAAAIPLCGGGDASHASVIAKTPIWAFHGAADPTVPVARSREMIAAVKRAGGNPLYTEYPGVGHEVWFKAFQEKGLVEWLFAQHK